MRIVINKKQENKRESIPNNSFLNSRIGFFATVTNVNSVTNTVDVISDIGQTILGLDVMSNQWVIKKDDYVSGERFLPPIGSRVFVLTPSPGRLVGAFVLCSGFAKRENSTHEIFAKTPTEKEEFNNQKETVTQGGWDIKEDYKTGNIEIKNKDKKISLILKNDTKEINIKSYDNCEIVVNENGINIKGKVVVSDGDFTVGGTVSPSGSGALCGLPFCLFTGAAQTGNKAIGT